MAGLFGRKVTGTLANGLTAKGTAMGQCTSKTAQCWTVNGNMDYSNIEKNFH